jgi:hypothetical protein
MLTQTRAELLDSSPRYDRMRDGEHALPMGTAHTQVPYTGKIRHIGLADLAPDRAMFWMRTQPDMFPAHEVAIKTAARARRADTLDLYDWDCHKCQTAVMTPDLSDVCPNCLL